MRKITWHLAGHGELDVNKSGKEKHSPDGIGDTVKKYLWVNKKPDIMGTSARPGQKGRERKCTSVTNRSGILFDLLNESNGLGIADLNVENRKNLLTVRTEDGSVFELVCREATEKENGWKNAN